MFQEEQQVWQKIQVLLEKCNKINVNSNNIDIQECQNIKDTLLSLTNNVEQCFKLDNLHNNNLKNEESQQNNENDQKQKQDYEEKLDIEKKNTEKNLKYVGEGLQEKQVNVNVQEEKQNTQFQLEFEQKTSQNSSEQNQNFTPKKKENKEFNNNLSTDKQNIETHSTCIENNNQSGLDDIMYQSPIISPKQKCKGFSDDLYEYPEYSQIQNINVGFTFNNQKRQDFFYAAMSSERRQTMTDSEIKKEIYQNIQQVEKDKINGNYNYLFKFQ